MQIWMASPSKTAASLDLIRGFPPDSDGGHGRTGGSLRRTTPLNPLTVLMDGGATDANTDDETADGGVERRLTRLNPHLPLLCGT